VLLNSHVVINTVLLLLRSHSPDKPPELGETACETESIFASFSQFLDFEDSRMAQGFKNQYFTSTSLAFAEASHENATVICMYSKHTYLYYLYYFFSIFNCSSGNSAKQKPLIRQLSHML
jgi:hypothetical protein